MGLWCPERRIIITIMDLWMGIKSEETIRNAKSLFEILRRNKFFAIRHAGKFHKSCNKSRHCTFYPGKYPLHPSCSWMFDCSECGVWCEAIISRLAHTRRVFRAIFKKKKIIRTWFSDIILYYHSIRKSYVTTWCWCVVVTNAEKYFLLFPFL